MEQLSTPEVQDWIWQHKAENPRELIFKKSPFYSVSMQAIVEQIQGIQKIKHKVPLLVQRKGILFPPSINIEQTSSWTTAKYKANILNYSTLIDITGGLGIDTLAFACRGKEIYHLESNLSLQSIAEHNFTILNKKNIKSICTDGIAFLQQCKKKFDVVYADPSRRNSHQSKVFMLEDVSPLPFEIVKNGFLVSDTLMLKLSPMLDIKNTLRRLKNISEIHLISVKNELKELLLIIRKKQIALPTVHCINLETTQPDYNFAYGDELNSATYSAPKKYLYSPNSSVMKSGAFSRIAIDFNLEKLSPNTHLYTSDTLVKNFPGEIFGNLSIVESPKKALKNQSIRALRRNFPANLKKLRQQYKFNDDGQAIVIFTSSVAGNHILKAERIHHA